MDRVLGQLDLDIAALPRAIPVAFLGGAGGRQHGKREGGDGERLGKIHLESSFHREASAAMNTSCWLRVSSRNGPIACKTDMPSSMCVPVATTPAFTLRTTWLPTFTSNTVTVWMSRTVPSAMEKESMPAQ